MSPSLKGVPSKILIGTSIYDIELKKEVYLNNHECYGTHSRADLKIELSQNYKNHNSFEILFHEIIHAFCDEYGVDPKEHGEEHTANMFGKALVNLFVDNPKLLAYINAQAKRMNKAKKEVLK